MPAGLAQYYLHIELQLSNKGKNHLNFCYMEETQCYPPNISSQPSTKILIIVQTYKQRMASGFTTENCQSYNTRKLEERSVAKKPPKSIMIIMLRIHLFETRDYTWVHNKKRIKGISPKLQSRWLGTY